MCNNIISIFCDESCHIPNDHNEIMTLGAITIPRTLVRSVSKEIREFKTRFNCNGELKWTKVSEKNLPFYNALIELFAGNPDIGFRALVVKNKDRLDHDQYNQGDPDSFYYKMYYYLIRNIIENRLRHIVHVYVDIKDTRSAEKVRQLKTILANRFRDFDFDKIQKIQQIRSHESELMQMSDFLLGAVTYKNRGLNQSQGKLKIVSMVENKLRVSLSESSPPWETKFNLFHFVPRGE